MKKTILFCMCLLLVAVPLTAQEKADKPAEGEMSNYGPPPPLDDAWTKWMLGEWQGTTKSPMGESTDWMKCELGLGGQFQMLTYKSQSAMGEFTGLGAFTFVGDEVRAYWMDSWRDMSEGKGKLEGNRMVMEWEGRMGHHTRTIERVSDDKMVIIAKWTSPDGQPMQARTELTRKKAMGGK
ncbi:MAG: hypothetical protein D6743_05130 [Calditrichaeota bacterium]|nr:MAG: hypothetical protein D6743_05130 [Calditrichota bacterium]